MDKDLQRYAQEARQLSGSPSTREETYYPAIKGLLESLLSAQRLPFDVRTNTSERRSGGGTDVPDLALYDGAGEFLAVCGEVKPPDRDINEMALSEDRDDQVGRYLARTRVVLLSNVRAFGLLTTAAEHQSGPVPPKLRRVEQVVELWPSASALRQGKPVLEGTVEQLAELVETAVTRYAPIAEPESLARILARQARRAKAALPKQFGQAVRDLLDDFGKALGISFHGPEGEEFFRSSLIQTAFYALFAGWALWRYSKGKRAFRWEDLSDYLKIPFLGELFYEFRHPKRIAELGLAPYLDVATETLGRVDTERFFSRFQLPSLKPRRDEPEPTAAVSAITYFYEPFLEAFDPELRKELGVWYTPYEIVRYQVRLIDRLLREELSCNRGFADDRVVVLDPCCGTGAYLIEVMRCVADQIVEEGDEAMLGSKLRDAVCRRVIGFEILTAPFVIAQLQVYLLLSELDAAPGNGHRPAVYLTNALTGWSGPSQLKLHFPEMQQEHDAAERVKQEGRIIVILGNPPYNRFAGVPLKEEADLADHYKGIRRDENGKQIGQSELYTRWKVRKHLLDDLYVRFFRLGEQRIGEKAEHGIVSFISNASYLAGRSHPLMRESLLRNFQKVWVDNLHGNRLASERTPWGDSCETVFNLEQGGPGIKVGTCVTTLLKSRKRAKGESTVFVRDFWGRAAAKRRALLESLELDAWSASRRKEAEQRPEGPRPYEAFEPTAATAWKFVPQEAMGGFEEWPSLDELFPVAFQGVNHNRGLEGSVIDTDRTALEARMRDYFSAMAFDALKAKYPALCEARAGYDAAATRDKLKRIGLKAGQIVAYQLFPLDLRWIYYDKDENLLNRRRPELWDNLGENEFLITVPQPRRESETRPLLGDCLFDLHLHDRGSVGFPVFSRKRDLFDAGSGGARVANVAVPAWERLKLSWGLKGALDGEAATRTVKRLFRICVALMLAPQYERDHKESLAQDWAHIPIPKSAERAAAIADLGESVTVLLNPRSDPAGVVRKVLGAEAKTIGVVSKKGSRTVQEADLRVERSYYGAAAGGWEPRAPSGGETSRSCWGEGTGDLYLGDEVFVRHVPERVWRFELGGYPVLKKWLGYREAKRRDGRPLALPEIDHFRSMVQRLAALLVLHEELDRAYEAAVAEAMTRDELGLVE